MPKHVGPSIRMQEDCWKALATSQDYFSPELNLSVCWQGGCIEAGHAALNEWLLLPLSVCLGAILSILTYPHSAAEFIPPALLTESNAVLPAGGCCCIAAHRCVCCVKHSTALTSNSASSSDPDGLSCWVSSAAVCCALLSAASLTAAGVCSPYTMSNTTSVTQ